MWSSVALTAIAASILWILAFSDLAQESLLFCFSPMIKQSHFPHSMSFAADISSVEKLHSTASFRF